jgi:hypothetical protein
MNRLQKVHALEIFKVQVPLKMSQSKRLLTNKFNRILPT